MPVCGNCHRDAPDGALFCSFCGATIKPATGAGEAADPLIGQTVAGKYFIHQILGHGGMGDVYKATHLTLDRPVVLKLLKKLFHSDPSLVQRFHREARAASRLNHPNSISIIDFGQTDDGTLFMAMEFLSGRSLERLIAEDHPIAEGRVIHIVAQILAALGEAHALGIIHRDLKPANVMVEARRDEPDFVKVLDFGIAKLNEPGQGGAGLTQAGIVCGTPGYMSPEQVRGDELDARSDLYAMGVILYEMFTGVLPFESNTPMGLVTRHLVEDPPPMALRRPGTVVSPDLEAVIMRALARDRDARFASAEEMRAAILACGAPVPGPLRPTPAPSSTMIFDPSMLGAPPAAGRAQTGRSRAASWPTPVHTTAIDTSEVPFEPSPPRPSRPVAPAARTPPSRPATGPAQALPDAAKGTPAPVQTRPATAKGKTPPPARKPPSRPAAPAATTPAAVIRHEMDEESEGAEEAAAPAATAAARSKGPLVAGAGAAALVIIALVVWGLTRETAPAPGASASAAAASTPQPEPAPVAQPQPVAPGPQPVAPAPGTPAPTVAAVAGQEPTPAPLVRDIPLPPPPVLPAQPSQPVVSQPAPTPPPPRKGIRLVKQELNSIPTPKAASGEGVLAVVATPWAEVEIEGREIGETPRELLLGAGTYRVRASHPALGTREQTVTVRAGKRQVWSPTFAH